MQCGILQKSTLYKRLMLIAGGLILAYPVALYDAIGVSLMVAAFISQKLKKEAVSI